MKKVVAAINMTLDGFCDHTAMIPDDEIHDHYTCLLQNAGTILFGRITYQLMEYWKPIVKNPTGNPSLDEFAVTIDNISKIVFSHTLDNVEWKNVRLAEKDLKEEVLELKKSGNGESKDILIGSRSLIVSLTKLNLINEYQICILPVILGNGLPLFKDLNQRVGLKLLKTKTFGSGAQILYYEPVNE